MLNIEQPIDAAKTKAGAFVARQASWFDDNRKALVIGMGVTIALVLLAVWVI